MTMPDWFANNKFLQGLTGILGRVFLFIVLGVLAMALKIYFLSFLISLAVVILVVWWCFSYIRGQILKARKK